jgi:acetyltransferase-like isoleucine patch superfamily enzyme
MKTDYIKYDNVILGENVVIGHGSIIYPNVIIGDNTIVGPYSTIGEPTSSFYSQDSGDIKKHIFTRTFIGQNSILRSQSIIYEDVEIGEGFQSGHRVTIRENSIFGVNCSVGTLSDIQGKVTIGNYVRLHSNVHIGQLSRIEDYVWIFPYVILTNDQYPPMDDLCGVTIKEYAVIATASVILPGVIIGKNALVGAHSVVTKNVKDEMLVLGNPAKARCSVREVKDRDGNPVYPWKDYLKENRGYPWQIKGEE